MVIAEWNGHSIINSTGLLQPIKKQDLILLHDSFNGDILCQRLQEKIFCQVLGQWWTTLLRWALLAISNWLILDNLIGASKSSVFQNKMLLLCLQFFTLNILRYFTYVLLFFLYCYFMLHHVLLTVLTYLCIACYLGVSFSCHIVLNIHFSIKLLLSGRILIRANF